MNISLTTAALIGLLITAALIGAHHLGYYIGKKDGYKQGKKDAVGRMNDFKYWMGNYPIVYNTLHILGLAIKGNYSTWYLRDEILKHGEKRFDDGWAPDVWQLDKRKP